MDDGVRAIYDTTRWTKKAGRAHLTGPVYVEGAEPATSWKSRSWT
jgi:hypothetical protein